MESEKSINIVFVQNFEEFFDNDKEYWKIWKKKKGVNVYYWCLEINTDQYLQFDRQVFFFYELIINSLFVDL